MEPKGAQQIVALCERRFLATAWTPGTFSLEPELYRDVLAEIATLLKERRTLRYALGQRAAFDRAGAAIDRALGRWSAGDTTPLSAPGKGEPNPLSVAYCALVHGGARLSAADGFAPVVLSDVERTIVDALYAALVDTVTGLSPTNSRPGWHPMARLTACETRPRPSGRSCAAQATRGWSTGAR